jgi:hypothetical protein
MTITHLIISGGRLNIVDVDVDVDVMLTLMYPHCGTVGIHQSQRKKQRQK